MALTFSQSDGKCHFIEQGQSKLEDALNLCQNYHSCLRFGLLLQKNKILTLGRIRFLNEKFHRSAVKASALAPPWSFRSYRNFVSVPKNKNPVSHRSEYRLCTS